MNQVRVLLDRVRARVLSESALACLANGLAVAAVGALAFELTMRRWPRDLQWPFLVTCAVAGAVVALAGWLRAWPSWTQVAELADSRLGGRERLVTALQFAAEGGWLYDRQREDAATFATSADLAALGPFRWPWRALAVAALAGAAALTLAILPNPALQDLRRHQAARAAQEQSAGQVEAVARQAAAQARPGEDPAKRQALQSELQKAANNVRKAPDPQSAVASLTQSQDALRQLQDPNLASKQDAAAAAGRALENNPQASKAGAALNQQDLKQAAGELGNLAQSLPNLSTAQRQQLAQSLAQAADAASGDPKLSSSLRDASNALQKGDTQAAQQALQAAAQQAQSVAASEDFQGDVNQAINGLQQAKGPAAQEAQAQQGAGQQGAGQSGQGGQPGSGQGSARQGGSGQGAGTGASGSGSGGSSSGASGQGGPGTGGATGGNSGVKPVGGTEKVYVTGQAEGTSGNGTNEKTGAGVQNDLVPYDQVLAEYRDAALNQVDRASIPESQRQLVQQYFSDLSK